MINLMSAAALGCWLGIGQAPVAPAAQPAVPPATALPVPGASPVAEPAGVPQLPLNTIVARVNGQNILESAVQRGLERFPPAKRAEVRNEMLQFLIDTMLVDQYLLAARIPATPEEVAKRVDEMKAEAKKQNREFEKILEGMRLTPDELLVHVAAEIRWEKFIAQQGTDKALETFFNSDKALFDGSTVRARHILFSAGAATEEKAKAVGQARAVKAQIDQKLAAELAKNPGGPDKLGMEKRRTEALDDIFSATARDISTCPSKAQGGDVGFFARDGSMVEAFSRAAFAMEPYTMSDAVETPFGYHLIMVLEKKPGKQVTFETVKEEVREVFGEKMKEQMAKQLRTTAKIEIAGVR
ncbi:MAG: peptidylprolyl isomerase [Planctomycetota bacterium]